MIAIVLAHGRGFARDRLGFVMTLLLPPLMYLLFGAIFAAGSPGEINSTVRVHDMVGSSQSAAIVQGLASIYGDKLTLAPAVQDVDGSVASGLADAGLVIAPTTGAALSMEIVESAEDMIASMVLAGQTGHVVERTSPRSADTPSTPVTHRLVGPQGDYQRTNLAGTVSTLFVFFTAMHGAMSGLDDRRSGLQARLALTAGGLGRVLGARVAWLTLVGLAQTLCIFAVAFRFFPAVDLELTAAWLATAVAVAFAAGGVAMALCAACRSREQAQPLSTVLFLLFAALGGSMFPRHLMPPDIQEWSWLTPHAWAVECYRSLVWQGTLSGDVLAGWSYLALVGIVATSTALVLENRAWR